MKVGDILTIKCRFMTYSKILMRYKGYEYSDVTYQIEAVFPNSLIVRELDIESMFGGNLQLLEKQLWQRLKRTKQNWKD